MTYVKTLSGQFQVGAQVWARKNKNDSEPFLQGTIVRQVAFVFIVVKLL